MPALTELEEQLAGPDGPRVRRELMAALQEHEARLRATVLLRLPREEFTQAAALLDATTAALEVLERWRPAPAPRGAAHPATDHPPRTRSLR